MSLKAGSERSTARRACRGSSLSCRNRRQMSLRAAPAVFRPRPRFRSPAKPGAAEDASPNPQPTTAPDDLWWAGTPAYQCMRMDFVSRLKRSGRSESQPMVARPDGSFPRVKTCLGALMGFARKPRGFAHSSMSRHIRHDPQPRPKQCRFPQLSLNRPSYRLAAARPRKPSLDAPKSQRDRLWH